MPDQDITPFDEGTQAVAAPAVTTIPEGEQNTNQYEALLAGIVNEEGTQKYSDVSTALAALTESQRFITTLKGEAVEKDKLIAENVAAEKLLEAVTNKGQQEPQSPAAAPTVDASAVARIVEHVVSSNEQKKTADTNMDSVVTKLSEHYGDASKAKEAYIAKADEMGLSIPQLNKLASDSPTAALAMFGTTPTKTASITQSSVNTTGFEGRPAGEAEVQEAFKGVMGFSSSSQVANAWSASKKSVLSKLEGAN